MEMVKGERWITLIIRISGYSSILFVSLILIFLAREGLPALGKVPLGDLFGTRWYPIESYFGILPLIFGSVLVTVGALAIGIPFGIGTAVYLSELAPAWIKNILKPVIEILAGLPSVVLGFLGIQLAAPFFRQFLNLPTGLTAFTGAVLLGFYRYPHHCFHLGRRLEHRPKHVSSGRHGAGRQPLANDLGCDGSGSPFGFVDGGDAGGWPRDWRDHGCDDGHRQRAGVAT